MSGLGLRIDHKAIHIANGAGNGSAGGYATEPMFPIPGDEDPEYPTPEGDRIRLVSVQCEPDSRGYCEVTVEILYDGRKVKAAIREVDTRRGRMQAAARGAIDAVGKSAGVFAAFGLDGLEEFEVGDEDGILAVLTVLQGRERRRFHGAALEHADPESAAARAVLDGLNRYWAAPEGATVNA
jgi:hypothetical protein